MNIPEIKAGKRIFPREWKYARTLIILCERDLIVQTKGVLGYTKYYKLTEPGDRVTGDLNAPISATKA